MPKRGVGRYAYAGLDRVLHEKARLGILTALAGNPGGLLFNDLKELCALTDGNLRRHIAVLAEAELVAAESSPRRRGEGRTQTRYALTRDGRARYLEYLAELERVVADAAALRTADARRGRGGLRPRTA